MKASTCNDGWEDRKIGAGSGDKYPDWAWNKLLYNMGQRAMKEYGEAKGLDKVTSV